MCVLGRHIGMTNIKKIPSLFMAGAEFLFATTVLVSCWPSVEGADLFEPVDQTYKLHPTEGGI